MTSISPIPAGDSLARRRKPERERKSLIAWRGVIRKIARQGFMREADMRWAFARRLTDPMFVNPPARLNSLGGVTNGHGGANRFSTIDFFGEQLNRTHFIVVNDEKFRKWASAFLETRFRLKNPHPDRPLVMAFTHYMHDANLHWSGCTERRTGIWALLPALKNSRT